MYKKEEIKNKTVLEKIFENLIPVQYINFKYLDSILNLPIYKDDIEYFVIKDSVVNLSTEHFNKLVYFLNGCEVQRESQEIANFIRNVCINDMPFDIEEIFIYINYNKTCTPCCLKVYKQAAEDCGVYESEIILLNEKHYCEIMDLIISGANTCKITNKVFERYNEFKERG